MPDPGLGKELRASSNVLSESLPQVWPLRASTEMVVHQLHLPSKCCTLLLAAKLLQWG